MTTPRDRRIAERAPIAVFAAVEAAALVLYMVLGRGLWFYNDEWDYLVTRRAGDVGDLFRPHGPVTLTPRNAPLAPLVCLPAHSSGP